MSHVVRRDVRPADSAGQIRRQFYFTNALKDFEDRDEPCVYALHSQHLAKFYKYTPFLPFFVFIYSELLFLKQISAKYLVKAQRKCPK